MIFVPIVLKKLNYKQEVFDVENFIKNFDVSKVEKMAVIVFNKDGTTECGYFNMDLKDKAQAKHEIEIDIIDGVIQANKDRYFKGE